MSQSTIDIRLYKSRQDAIDLTRRVEELIDSLSEHGVYEKADQLFELLEILTDVRVNASDREGLAGDAIRRVFPMTTAGEKAIEAATRQIIPDISKWNVRAA